MLTSSVPPPKRSAVGISLDIVRVQSFLNSLTPPSPSHPRGSGVCVCVCVFGGGGGQITGT